MGVVRPRQTFQKRPGQLVAAAFWVLASLAYSLRFHGFARIVVVAVGVAFALTMLGLLRLSRRRTKLTMAQGELTFTSLFRERVISPARVVAVQVAWGGASGRQTRLWALVNAAGRAVAGLNRDAWDDAELEGLRQALGLPIETVSTPQRPAALRRAYPGLVPWWGAHPVAATSLTIVGLAALLLVAKGLGA